MLKFNLDVCVRVDGEIGDRKNAIEIMRQALRNALGGLEVAENDGVEFYHDEQETEVAGGYTATQSFDFGVGGE